MAHPGAQAGAPSSHGCEGAESASSASGTSQRSAQAHPWADEGCVVVPLGYRMPYRYDLLIGFLGFRAIAGVEVVHDGCYARTCRIGNDVGWIAVENDADHQRILLTVSRSLAQHADALCEKTRRLFDTDCDPNAVTRTLADFYTQVDPRYHIEGVRLPCSFDPFEMATRAIIGQQITVKAANTLAGRMADRFGEACETPIEGLRTVFPAPSVFLEEDVVDTLGELGIIRQRANAIRLLAAGIEDGSLELGVGCSTERGMKGLLALPGIGPWTANYILMRAFHYADAFPAADYGLKLAFPGLKPREIERLSEAWRPYRSYAVMCTWSV